MDLEVYRTDPELFIKQPADFRQELLNAVWGPDIEEEALIYARSDFKSDSCYSHVDQHQPRLQLLIIAYLHNDAILPLFKLMKFFRIETFDVFPSEMEISLMLRQAFPFGCFRGVTLGRRGIRGWEDWLNGTCTKEVAIEILDDLATEFESLELGSMHCRDLFLVTRIVAPINDSIDVRVERFINKFADQPASLDDFDQAPFLFYPFMINRYPTQTHHISDKHQLNLRRPRWHKNYEADGIFDRTAIGFINVIKDGTIPFPRDLIPMFMQYLFSAHLDWLELMLELYRIEIRQFELEGNTEKFRQLAESVFIKCTKMQKKMSLCYHQVAARLLGIAPGFEHLRTH